MLPTRDSLQIKRYTETENKGMEKLYHAKRPEKITGVAILLSDKTDFKRQR